LMLSLKSVGFAMLASNHPFPEHQSITC
jgi:hypothetical protein